MELGQYFALVILDCILVVYGEEPVPIINKNEISNNDQFTMKCTIESFRGIDLPNSDVVTKLTMYRQLKDRKEAEYLGSVVSNAPRRTDPLDKKVPGGRRWDYSADGYKQRPNRHTIFIILYVKDATCLDAGYYWCAINLQGTNDPINSTKFNLQMREAKNIQLSPIKVTPTKSASFNTSENYVGDAVTMECTLTSWDPMKISWSFNTLYFEHNDHVVFHTNSWLTASGCRVHSQKSTKTVLLDRTMEDAIFFCRALRIGGEDTGVFATMKFTLSEYYSARSMSKNKAPNVKLGRNTVLILLWVVLLVC